MPVSARRMLIIIFLKSSIDAKKKELEPSLLEFQIVMVDGFLKTVPLLSQALR